MVNRRHIRIKVMQSIYAMLQSKSDDLEREEKFLLYNIKKTADLFALQVILLLEIRDLALEHIEIKKKKYLATDQDKNPNLRFVQNAVFLRLDESPEIQDFYKNKKRNIWKDNREYVRVILDEMQDSPIYKSYMAEEANGPKQDIAFVTALFKEILAPNEKLFDFYESLNMSWVDDYPLVNTMILKTLKGLNRHTVFSLTALEVDEEDEAFMVDLFRKTLLHQNEFTDEIDEKTPNWDSERIADTDMVLIKMALTEFLYFPSIPTKVTINEYIEISKDYSTGKSSYFINGVLDKLLKEYNASGRLKKVGRGLL